MVSKHIELLLLLEVMRTSSIEHVDEDEGDFNLSILLFAMDNLPSIGRASLTNEQLVCTMSDQKYTVAPRNNDFFCAGQQNCNLFGGPYYETFLFFFFLTVRQLDAPTSLKLDDYD
nr:hypothetical protein YHR131w-a - yeast (Saccharomyces cerevisiae) [Saccharomyces cerevisiae]